MRRVDLVAVDELQMTTDKKRDTNLEFVLTLLTAPLRSYRRHERLRIMAIREACKKRARL